MNAGKSALLGGFLAAFVLSMAGGSASAQSLQPMRGVVQSATDRFAMRLRAMNFANDRQVFSISVYDPDWTPVEGARASAQRLAIGPDGSSEFVVIVPFREGEIEREVLVCSTSEPQQGAVQAVRGRVCGRFYGRRLQLAE